MNVVERNPAIAGFVDSGFDERIEKGGEGVVVLGQNGIVFVVVAFGAAGGKTCLLYTSDAADE